VLHIDIYEYNTIPRVAVLLAAYNGEKWIANQIVTIVHQKGVDVHIYVSVDLSTDDTFKIVCDLAKNHSEMTILPYGQRFGNAAFNFFHLLLSVPIENYDYIALADQDDVWHEDKLFSAIDLLVKKNADGYSSNVVAFWKSGKKRLIKKSFSQKSYDYLFEAPGPGCTFVLRKILGIGIKKIMIEKKDVLLNMKVHDWFIYAYARSRDFKWIIDSNHYIEYRQHEKNEVGANVGPKAFILRTKLMLAGYGIFQVMYMINILNLGENSFVKRWYGKNRVNLLLLALNAGQCRRSKKDQIFFFFMCILLWLLKHPF
jgi:rhamnosyltransferase